MADEIRKGLEGVVADLTSISRVDPETGTLTYRGYPVPVLAERCSFEEVAYLLWHGELPTRSQLRSFQSVERRRRALPRDLEHILHHCPRTSHPMDVVRTAVSYLGLSAPDSPDPDAMRAKAVDLMARIPTVVAFDARLRQGLETIPPRKDLSLSENFFWMTFGRVPHPDVVKAFDVSLILYAEHGFNASTFAARVVTSTMADLHGAVTAGIAALKGHLHGGANEAVMADLAQVGEPANARAWLEARLAAHEKVMGFGHRVYKEGDSRVPTAGAWGRRVAAVVGNPRWHAVADALRDAMVEARGLHPNLDFETGPMYALMGFVPAVFTPIFVMGRVVGWTAHVIEQAGDNRLIRPLGKYVGVPTRSFVPIDRRGTPGEPAPDAPDVRRAASRTGTRPRPSVSGRSPRPGSPRTRHAPDR